MIAFRDRQTGEINYVRRLVDADAEMFAELIDADIVSCFTCKWYIEFEGVCVNSKSRCCADFTMPDFGCEKWEVRDGQIDNSQ